MRGSGSARPSAMGAAWAALAGVLWALLTVVSAAPAAVVGGSPASGHTPGTASSTPTRPAPMYAGRGRGPATNAAHHDAPRAARGGSAHAGRVSAARGATAAHHHAHAAWAYGHASAQAQRNVPPPGHGGAGAVPERVALPADRLVTAEPRRGPPASVTTHLGAARGRAPPVSAG